MLKPTPSTCLLLLVTQFSCIASTSCFRRSGRERVAVSDLGPFDRRSRKVFASGKSWQNLSDYTAVLLDIPNMNRAVHTRSFRRNNLSVWLWGPENFRGFRKTVPGTSEKWATSCHLNTDYVQSLG